MTEVQILRPMEYFSKMKEQDPNKNIRQLGVFITLPFVLAIPPIFGWFVGNWIDGKLQTSPFFMFFFLAMGFAAGVREVYRIIKRFGDGT